MKVAIVLHLYQPPTQDESVFRKVVSECYLPLIKLIKSKKTNKFVLNIPLSLLEMMDKYGYYEWIQDIKNLIDSNRIEVTGSAAYHSLLTKLPQTVVEQQVVLNEYGMGYYLGNHQGFEGEPSIVIKDLNGFFSPELAVNNQLHTIISDLGYKWFLVDQPALSNVSIKIPIFNVPDKFSKIVCRNKRLSNILAFKRTPDLNDFFSEISELRDNTSSVIIALDGETFGHHYKEGIYLLEEVLSGFQKLGLEMSLVSDLIDDFEPDDITGIAESTWGVSDENISDTEAYPYWIDEDNELLVSLWDIQRSVLEYCEDMLNVSFDLIDFNIPFWKFDTITSLTSIQSATDSSDTDCKKNLTNVINIHKFLNSDKFWWLSKKHITPDKYLFNKDFALKSLDYIKPIVSCLKDSTIQKILNDKVLSLENQLK